MHGGYAEKKGEQSRCEDVKTYALDTQDCTLRTRDREPAEGPSESTPVLTPFGGKMRRPDMRS